MKNVLITGFEPFGGDTLNPSAQAARELDGGIVAGRRVTGRVLPCVFGESLAVLRREIRRLKPGLVICAGQAGGRGDIGVERLAVNVVNADIPDNAGHQPADGRVARRGPAAYWSTLPVDAIVAALRAAELPAAVSHSAGTFVCNHVFHGLMRMLAQMRAVRGGFIHLPYLPAQARRIAGCPPSLGLARIVRGLEIAIEISLATNGT
jgi:pyroglutamyl-peptidase